VFLKKTVINTNTFFQLTTYLRFLLIVKRFFYFLLKIIAHISKFYTACYEVYFPLKYLVFFVLSANAHDINCYSYEHNIDKINT